MEIKEIKDELESTYLVGFNVSGSQNAFEITLDGSSQDKFKVSGAVKDNIRLNIEVEPEKYAGNFLRLINYSDMFKRKGFVALMSEIPTGDVSIFVNKVKISADDFINDSSEWNSFEIRYTKIPYDDSALVKRITRVMCGMMLSLVDYSVEGFEEGSKIDIHASKYERNPINREICLASKGYKCCICGFDFEKTYGEIGRKVIEVHHTKQVSEMGPGYIVKPLEELVPVCSNCHTIIHKRKEPYTVEEVKAMLVNQDG